MQRMEGEARASRGKGKRHSRGISHPCRIHLTRDEKGSYLAACACWARKVSICCLSSNSDPLPTSGDFGSPAIPIEPITAPGRVDLLAAASRRSPSVFLLRASARKSLREASLEVLPASPSRTAFTRAPASLSKLGRLMFQPWPRGICNTTFFISSAMQSGQRDLTR